MELSVLCKAARMHRLLHTKIPPGRLRFVKRGGTLAKMLLIMRITVILLLAAALHVSAKSYSQKVNITARHISLEKALYLIQKQTGYSFLCAQQLLENAEDLNLYIKEATLPEAMKTLLSDPSLMLTYTIKEQEKIVLIYAKPIPVALPRAGDLPVFTSPFYDVQGRVESEKGEPLVGVSIRLRGTKRGVTTDSYGRFSLRASAGDVLEFSMVGYMSQTITIANGKTDYNIVLRLDLGSQGMNDVVVVGYGTQKMTNVTGSITTVKMDDILGDRPVSTATTLLQGVVPGLQVNVASGQPGATARLNLRGATDIPIPGTGSAANTISMGSPLILVDNVPFNGSLNLLDPSDIETVTVLKDAGSAAIYGARSAFGVVLITTKKGGRNQRAQFTYSDNFTIATPMNLPKKATPLQEVQAYIDMGTTEYVFGQNTQTWLQLLQSYEKDPGEYPVGYTSSGGVRYYLKQTDVVKDLLGASSAQQMHNFAVSGGSEKSYYRMSLGTVNETGIIDPSANQDYFRRYTVKSSLSSDVTSWLTTQLDAGYYNSVQATPFYDAFYNAVNLPSYTPDGDTITVTGGAVLPLGTPKNLVGLSAPIITRNDDIRLTGRTILKPFAGMTVTGEYTFDNLRELYTSYDKQYSYGDLTDFGTDIGGTSTYLVENFLTDYNSLNVYGNYQRSFGKHNFSLMAGYNQESDNYQENQVKRTEMIAANLPSISQATGPTTGADNYSAYAIRGYFGRFTYDYMSKYLLQVNGRYDGSSNFPPGHQWGFFPSVSAGWRITQENFMKTLKPWLSEFKIRGSLGTVGNQSITPYSFIPGMTGYNPTWLNGGAIVTSLETPGLVSSNFTWETIETKDVGADFGLLKNHLTGSFDWYDRQTKNMLYNGIQLPSILGTGAPLENVAALDSKGYELGLNWNGRIGRVSYRIGGNLYDFQSKITRIQNAAGLLSQYYVGQKLGQIWGYTTERLYQVSDFVPGSLNSTLTGGTLLPKVTTIQGSNPNPGDVMYKDLDGDGTITPGASTLSNPGDRRIIGDSTLRYQYGIRGGVSYKGFDFSFVLRGVGKNQSALVNVLTFPNEYSFGTLYSHELNYWTPTHTNSFYGRMYNQAAGNQGFNERVQTRFLQNGAYLKVTNLTLGYTPPIHLSRKAHVNRLQVFYSIENPFLLINHFPRGLDPEASVSNTSGNDLAYPYLRKSSVGVNLTL